MYYSQYQFGSLVRFDRNGTSVTLWNRNAVLAILAQFQNWHVKLCPIIGMQSMISIMCQFWHKTHIPSSHSYLHTYPVTPTTQSHISLTPTHHSLHISSSESHLISHSCTPTPSHLITTPSHISLTPTHLHFYLVVNQAVSHGEVLDQVGMVERTLLIVVKLLLDAPP